MMSCRFAKGNIDEEIAADGGGYWLRRAAQAAIPNVNASCPGGIELHAEAGGYAFINGQPAELKVYDPDAFDVKQGRTTVSVIIDPDGRATVSYTAPGGASGACEAQVFDS